MVSLPLTQTIVTPLEHTQSLRAARTFTLAFADDPLLRYLTNNQTAERSYRAGEGAFMTAIINLWILRKLTLTVDGGKSILIASLNKETSTPQGFKDSFVDWLTTTLFTAAGSVGSRESKTRQKEVNDKIHAAVREAFGERLDTMMYLDAVATEPESQGTGYGTVLMKFLADLSSLTHQPIWLHTSNPDSIRFYQSRGFRSVTRVVVGDQDPNWHDIPVTINIMILEPGKYAPRTAEV